MRLFFLLGVVMLAIHPFDVLAEETPFPETGVYSVSIQFLETQSGSNCSCPASFEAAFPFHSGSPVLLGEVTSSDIVSYLETELALFFAALSCTAVITDDYSSTSPSQVTRGFYFWEQIPNAEPFADLCMQGLFALSAEFIEEEFPCDTSCTDWTPSTGIPAFSFSAFIDAFASTDVVAYVASLVTLTPSAYTPVADFCITLPFSDFGIFGLEDIESCIPDSFFDIIATIVQYLVYVMGVFMILSALRGGD